MADLVPLVEALRRPTLTVPAGARPWWQRLFWFHRILGPKTYTGRVLSHAQFEPFVDRLLDLEDRDLAADPLEMSKLLRDYMKAIGIPWRHVERMPSVLQLQVAADFFGCQSDATPTSGEKRRQGLVAMATKNVPRAASPAT